VLHQRVTHGVRTVLGFEHHNFVFVASETVARLDLHDLDGELVSFDTEGDCCAQNALGALRPVERYRSRSVLETHGSQKTGDAEHVIGVIVAEENLLKAESHAIPHHLALVPLPTVEQQRFPLALNG
jgi:hypothetical protein